MPEGVYTIPWPGEPHAPIRVDVGPMTRYFPLHSHEFAEIVIVIAGEITLSGGVREVRARAGEALISTPGEPHGIRDSRDLHAHNVQFVPASLCPMLRSLSGLAGYGYLQPRSGDPGRLVPHKVSLPAGDFGRLRGLSEHLTEELRSIREGHGVICEALLASMLVLLLREAGQPCPSQVADLRRVSQVTAYIDEHLCDHFTVRSLADMAGMSRSAFCRDFVARVGEPPMSYVIGRRVFRAQYLLASTGMKVVDVAERVGFSDASYLARQFRRRMGFSPARSRRE